MIKSMTGFGSAEGAVGGARVSVEIRSVNHRFFNPSVKLPSELSKWEAEVRDARRANGARGGAHRRGAFRRLRRADSVFAGSIQIVGRRRCGGHSALAER